MVQMAALRIRSSLRERVSAGLVNETGGQYTITEKGKEKL
jgi:predicted transcriptional regulator